MAPGVYLVPNPLLHRFHLRGGVRGIGVIKADPRPGCVAVEFIDVAAEFTDSQYVVSEVSYYCRDGEPYGHLASQCAIVAAEPLHLLPVESEEKPKSPIKAKLEFVRDRLPTKDDFYEYALGSDPAIQVLKDGRILTLGLTGLSSIKLGDPWARYPGFGDPTPVLKQQKADLERQLRAICARLEEQGSDVL